MSHNKYAFGNFNNELMARALGRDVAVSTKQGVEIANYLRHRKLNQAKSLLEKVMQKKHPIPFKRFTDGLGHKPGKLASGRYPVKAAKAFLKLLESAEANAQTKGLNTNDLEIIHICTHKAHSPVHYGRHSGREFKRSHIEVVVQETAGKNKEQDKLPGKGTKSGQEQNKQEKKQEPQKETKPEEKKTGAPKSEGQEGEKQEKNKEQDEQASEQQEPTPSATPSEDQK